jgi:hypothetical protein
MVDRNSRLNIILGIICAILVIVIIYLISYRNNVESANVYFKINDIKNITWRSEDAEFTTDGKKFTFKVGNDTIYDNNEFDLDVHTGMIISDTLYLRNVNGNNILIWYNEAEYRLERVG